MIIINSPFKVSLSFCNTKEPLFIGFSRQWWPFGRPFLRPSSLSSPLFISVLFWRLLISHWLFFRQNNTSRPSIQCYGLFSTVRGGVAFSLLFSIGLTLFYHLVMGFFFSSLIVPLVFEALALCVGTSTLMSEIFRWWCLMVIGVIISGLAWWPLWLVHQGYGSGSAPPPFDDFGEYLWAFNCWPLLEVLFLWLAALSISLYLGPLSPSMCANGVDVCLP